MRNMVFMQEIRQCCNIFNLQYVAIRANDYNLQQVNNYYVNNHNAIFHTSIKFLVI